MSIKINPEACQACGRCIEVCPGSLITEREGKALIQYPQQCWGCVSCVKECQFGAIDFYLGADIGGRGSTLKVVKEGKILRWQITKYNKETVTIAVNSQNSNTY